LQAGGPLALTLVGRSDDSSRDPCQLSFQGLIPPELPASLTDVTVQRLDAGRYRIAGSGQEWTVAARETYLQRDVGAAFYRAIPPRKPPLVRRIFFRLVLTLAGTSFGQRLLARRRG
jgi:hypothetical protein